MDLTFGIKTIARAVKARRAQRRKIAGPERRIGHNVPHRRKAAALAYSLIVGEEEQLVLDDRSADRATELVIFERVLRLKGILEEVPRIQGLVAEIFVERAAEPVRAAFGNSDNYAAAALA